jgi:pyruvate dehydrogenase E1 component
MSTQTVARYQPDQDRIETKEWLDALAAVIHFSDIDRAGLLLTRLVEALYRTGYPHTIGLTTSYTNTLPATHDEQAPLEGPEVETLAAYLRWNAAAMVLKAGKVASELGGHISTYASIATLYEVGFDYFFAANTETQSGDLVYFQGHSIPGIYARAFLEGRLGSEQLNHFRQEVGGHGLSSYPHPWLMPDFWQFPTVSMGLGPIGAIYQARFLHYLHNRKLTDAGNRHVWAFCGDGEMDEPESLGALSIAAREQLDNLIFVVNCNLQRLDGPVRGNGKIVQELESIFRGAGWKVIKLLWNSAWDQVFALDGAGFMKQHLEQILDGDMQRFASATVAERRQMLFSQSPERMAIGSQLSDADIAALGFGGHDRRKIYSAYQHAVQTTGRPVVILAHTVKGYGLGKATEGMNIAHNQKKLSVADLHSMRERFSIPVSDEDIEQLRFIKPPEDSACAQHLRARRQALGGAFPARREQADGHIPVPALSDFASILAGSEGRSISSTMAFVRILTLLLRDPHVRDRLVPIVPDESRTFGMEGLFRQIGIYAAHGQHYDPVDKGQIMYYKESQQGQLLEEGINEAGAFCSWLAAATAYSNHNYPMIPFYIYYSMFGFQRIGDLAWAAGDARARGFLLGATAGRTTLAGEGLQHTDGHSHVFSSVIPNCVSYDPTYSYELAVIIQHGLERMVGQNEDVYYYITMMNENYTHPAMPEGAETGIIRGMYKLRAEGRGPAQIVLFGCGAILREVEAAAQLLYNDYGIASDIWSITSFTELKRDAETVAHRAIHQLDATPELSYLAEQMAYHNGPILAATDYIRTYAEQIRPHIKQPYHTVGTDGYGRSDTRQQLRAYFGVDAKHIAYRAIYALYQSEALDIGVVQDAHARYQIDSQKPYTLYT